MSHRLCRITSSALLLRLKERLQFLDVLGDASLDARGPFVRVGRELAHPGLQEIALVGAAYGVMHRVLGAVSLIGPVRMDYEKAVGAVRSAATELSRFAESVYTDR